MKCIGVVLLTISAIRFAKWVFKMATAAVLFYRDLQFGEYKPGTARVEEYKNAGAALEMLANNGWRVSELTPRMFFKDEGYILHECRIIF